MKQYSHRPGFLPLKCINKSKFKHLFLVNNKQAILKILIIILNSCNEL